VLRHLIPLIAAALCALVAHAVPPRATTDPIPTPPPLSFTRGHVELVPMTLESLARAATAIVHGRVTGIETRSRDGLIVTDVTLMVAKTMKGEHRDQVSVAVAGGVHQGHVLWIPEAPTFRVGDELILFLWRPIDDPETGILGLKQGVVRVQSTAVGRTVLGSTVDSMTLATFEARVREHLSTDADNLGGK
jgi:hypothetical protein